MGKVFILPDRVIPTTILQIILDWKNKKGEPIIPLKKTSTKKPLGGFLHHFFNRMAVSICRAELAAAAGRHTQRQ